MKIDTDILNELVAAWKQKTVHPFDKVAPETEEIRLRDAEEKGRDQAIEECANELQQVIGLFSRA